MRAVSDSDESSTEDEESEVDEVIGLTNAEEDSDEDSEDDSEDDSDDDGAQDDDDSEDESEDEKELHATSGWGVSRRNFYDGEEADSSDSPSCGSTTEASPPGSTPGAARLSFFRCSCAPEDRTERAPKAGAPNMEEIR